MNDKFRKTLMQTYATFLLDARVFLNPPPDASLIGFASPTILIRFHIKYYWTLSQGYLYSTSKYPGDEVLELVQVLANHTELVEIRFYTE